MARGNGFITPKDIISLSLHFNDQDLNNKLVSYGKRVNLNVSQVAMMLCRSCIDTFIESLDREQYELLNEEAKIDTIMELKRRLKEAGIDA